MVLSKNLVVLKGEQTVWVGLRQYCEKPICNMYVQYIYIYAYYYIYIYTDRDTELE